MLDQHGEQLLYLLRKLNTVEDVQDALKWLGFKKPFSDERVKNILKYEPYLLNGDTGDINLDGYKGENITVLTIERGKALLQFTAAFVNEKDPARAALACISVEHEKVV